MEFIKYLIDLFLHLDVHLGALITEYQSWTYLILFIVVFCETGLVVTPFLPGDSLLFACGTFAALGKFELSVLFLLLAAAAIIGDSINYKIGSMIGPKVFDINSRFLKKEHLVKTHQFYEKHGGKTIIIARFMPIIRTFAPFVAGVGTMTYKKFFLYNVIGGLLWVSAFLFAGYFFGNIPEVKKNFTLVIMAIIVISVLPGVYQFIKHKTARAS
ncbi:MAG: DedA family protein [Syntrophothermus sp.]